ncbi:MAG: M48 family metalloprotease [Kordiimonadaceae bacterium]|nr:M48 family metalloprotease [Kordiimonadaceae bacterium]MBT6035864.1 M48 family metalloprotease [Kordiimonadaceae bacterium]MBT6328753.1 M48 family metalloprotease [Kordiimonadaceae bacterium]MBT7583523.1 M48 family metalloprotease [Kordiimonadaceae bacterium]
MKFGNLFKKRLIFIFPLILSACTTVNPATGSRDFTPFMSPAKERSLGREAHPGILEQNGGVYSDARVNQYVNDLGQRLVASSELSDYPFTFTVLDTPLVNAFALPGGYVYVTRGIMSMVGSESALASVIGHEIGHVTARHSAKRYNNQMFTGLGAALFGAVTGSNGITNSINQGAQLYLMGYSRNQEYQSDELGIRYSSRAGYDPYASADMLRSLDAEHKLQLVLAERAGEGEKSDFFSTHPNTQDRVSRAFNAATKTQIAQSSRDRRQGLYFNILDGMMWGDDPKQGVINGRDFIHPTMKLKFTAPEKYTLQNTSDTVLARGTGEAEGSIVLFAGASKKDMTIKQYGEKVWQAYKIENTMEDIQDIQINNMNATTGSTTMVINKQNYIVRLVAIEHSGESAYHFLMLTPQSKFQALSEGLQRMSYSFNKISQAEANNIKGRKIRIATAQPGDTVESIAKYMAFDDYKVERFIALNGLSQGQTLSAGQRLKLIVMED